MTRHQKCFILINIVAVTCIIQCAKAEPVNEENANSYSEIRIEALNKVVMAHASNSLPAQTEIVLPGGEKKTVLKIKEGLALHGVSIRMVEGKYIDVSKQVANDCSLNPDDQIQVAILNYFHQNFCINQNVKCKVPGEARARVNDIKNELKTRGISLRQDDDLFIVDFVSKETVGAELIGDVSRQTTNQTAVGVPQITGSGKTNDPGTTGNISKH